MSRFLVLALLAGALASGCAELIAETYPQYLVNTQADTSLPKTDLRAHYRLTPRTVSHRSEISSWAAGIANTWVVECGPMLEATLRSAPVQRAFSELKSGAGDDGSAEIVFDLVAYEFSDFGAHISLDIALLQGGQERLHKTYVADGKPQGGKVAMAGAFAMRNAIQQSTKLALDGILTTFLGDVKALPSP